MKKLKQSVAPAVAPSVDGMIREIVRSSVERYLASLGRTAPVVLPPARRGRPVVQPGCAVAGCRERHYAKGLCARHYQSARRARLAPRPSRRRAAARGRKGTIH